MTREEAISDIISLMDYMKYEWMGSDVPEALETAIEALKRQEPMLVIDVSDGYADGYDVFDEAECPACGFYFESADNIWKEPYCPHCGQALTWGG